MCSAQISARCGNGPHSFLCEKKWNLVGNNAIFMPKDIFTKFWNVGNKVNSFNTQVTNLIDFFEA